MSAPQTGDRALVSTGDPHEGILIARGFFSPAHAWGFSIILLRDGAIAVCACSATWPDLHANGQIFRRLGSPLDSLALAHAGHGAMRDRVHGGLFDLGQVTQDVLAQWGLLQDQQEIRS
jgi:hypothetical protein